MSYYLHTDTLDEWQLGRLINRIHNLATLRLAAIARIGDLIKAGEIAERVAARIKTADEAIQLAFKGLSSDPPTERMALAKHKEIMKAPEKTMQDVEAELKLINDLFPLDIVSRLEKSRYYTDRFMKGADVFRVERIEGFQVYKEFVSRRMNGLFGYVDLLHKRMEGIRGGMSELQRKNTILKTGTVTCEISNLTKEITKIQDFGEIALIGIIAPYYLSSIMAHTLKTYFAEIDQVWYLVFFMGTSLAVLVLTWRIINTVVDRSKRIISYLFKQIAFLLFFIVLVLAVYPFVDPSLIWNR